MGFEATPSMLSVIVLTIAAPLTTAFVLMFFGSRLERASVGRRVAGWTGWLAVLASAGSFIGAVVLFVDLLGRDEHHREVALRAADWISAGSF